MLSVTALTHPDSFVWRLVIDRTGKIQDSLLAGVIEPSISKIKSLGFATEAVTAPALRFRLAAKNRLDYAPRHRPLANAFAPTPFLAHCSCVFADSAVYPVQAITILRIDDMIKIAPPPDRDEQ